MRHQKRVLFTIWVGLIITITTLGWNFPLQEVARPDCKGSSREMLSEDCKININEAKTNEDLARVLFSALRGSSYDKPQTKDSGGHPSLDMPSSPGTPVYAIQEGIIISAKEKNGYGLSVTIKHTKHTQDQKEIYSNYSHLQESLVSEGQTVVAGQQIGKLGCSGFSISGDPSRCGNHLDFQLTTADSPTHPYGYSDCKEGYMTAVQKGSCRDKMKKYTIDPLEFFKQYANISFAIPVIQEIENKEKSKNENITNKLQDLFSRIREQNQTKINKATTHTAAPEKEEIITDTTKLHKEVTTKQFEKTNQISKDGYTISRERNTDPQAIIANKTITYTLIITDQFGNPITDTLPQVVSVKLDNFILGSFFPTGFVNIVAGKKHLFFQSIQPGNASLSLRRGEEKIAEETISVK